MGNKPVWLNLYSGLNLCSEKQKTEGDRELLWGLIQDLSPSQPKNLPLSQVFIVWKGEYVITRWSGRVSGILDWIAEYSFRAFLHAIQVPSRSLVEALAKVSQAAIVLLSDYYWNYLNHQTVFVLFLWLFLQFRSRKSNYIYCNFNNYLFIWPVITVLDLHMSVISLIDRQWLYFKFYPCLRGWASPNGVSGTCCLSK